ncbi:TetR/AcrR family transcriptional regulator [Cryobacterium psychrophilum]|uniref:TetR/AcrR family transcriptional regulator n=1 Tax=Cryobacterium psychrophilum TaxID=41988 RepID=A0A4Y8KPA5_9MICO|nr:TetR/AcrR family transcriptional regulator [Cryobacterium psychrophilum]TDW31511.1 TetR family transcriptional regulator [Cryobacterium psychrophilum]TFD79336.1 TetR/AcrR family transcriptional regulator [Cryobacterium psychrophilum]
MSHVDFFGEGSIAPGAQGRAEPIQQRSAARLSGLLDAAASVVDEVGFDRITTAMIAERAGASIGTVYRYYPDRVAVLNALHERAVLRLRERVLKEYSANKPETWWDAVDGAITAFVGLYRSEPGFRILNFTDREGPGIGEESELESVSFARELATVFAEEFAVPREPEFTFRLEVALELADALLSRAFQVDQLGDERFIAECRRVLYAYLSSFYGPNEQLNFDAAS